MTTRTKLSGSTHRAKRPSTKGLGNVAAKPRGDLLNKDQFSGHFAAWLCAWCDEKYGILSEPEKAIRLEALFGAHGLDKGQEAIRKWLRGIPGPKVNELDLIAKALLGKRAGYHELIVAIHDHAKS